jgi:hypothetical protein
MQIQFESPDREGRQQLFTHYLKSMKLTTSEVRGLLLEHKLVAHMQ